MIPDEDEFGEGIKGQGGVWKLHEYLRIVIHEYGNRILSTKVLPLRENHKNNSSEGTLKSPNYRVHGPHVTDEENRHLERLCNAPRHKARLQQQSFPLIPYPLLLLH